MKWKLLIFLIIFISVQLVSGATLQQDVINNYRVLSSTGNESKLYDVSVQRYNGSFDIVFSDKLGTNRTIYECECLAYNQSNPMGECIHEECEWVYYPVPTSLPAYIKPFDSYVVINAQTINFIKNFNISAINESNITTLERVVRYVKQNFRYNLNAVERTFTITVLKPLKNLWLKFGFESVIIDGSTSWNSTDVNVTQSPTIAHTEINISEVLFYMPFDKEQSSITRDYSRFNHDGTINNALWNSSGFIGGNYRFDGSGDYIEIATTQINDNNDKTISFWIYPLSHGTNFRRVMVKGKQTTDLAFTIGYSHVDAAGETSGYYGVFNDGSEALCNFGTPPKNTWTHFVVTYDESLGTTDCYNNSVLSVRENETTGWGLPATDKFWIGGREGVSQYFVGFVDELIIYNRTLTASEVVNIYNNQSSRLYDTGIQYFNQTIDMKTDQKMNVTVWDCGTLLSTELQAQANHNYTQNLTGCNATNIVVGGNRAKVNVSIKYFTDFYNFYTSWIGDNITFTPLSDYNTSFEENVTIYRGEQGFVTLPINDSSLIVYAPFDLNESKFRNHANYTMDGTLVGARYNKSGFADGAYSFSDPGTDYIILGDNADINIQDAPLTIMAWVRVTDLTYAGYPGIIASTENNGYAFILNQGAGNGNLMFSKVGVASEISALKISNSNWHHMAVVYNVNDTLAFFVDGVLDSTGLDSWSHTFSTGLTYGIGARPAAGDYWNGEIDEFMVLNRSLTPHEITAVYNNQSSRFLDTGELTFTETYNLGTNTTTNITLAGCQQLPSSNLTLSINGGTKTNVDTNCQANDITITGDATKVNITVHLESSPFNFYSPVLLGEILDVVGFGVSVTTTLNLTLLDYFAQNSSLQVIRGFNSTQLPAIETVKLVYNLSSGSNGDIDSWQFNFTAGGLSSCSLGNLQDMTCYNLSNPIATRWIEFINGSLTATYDGATGNQGDRITPVINKVDTTNWMLNLTIDEHYNPNVFKHYGARYNFSDVKWQTGVNQRITKDNIMMVHVKHDIIPLGADQYKLDFRVNYTTGVNTPLQPLDAFICNSNYNVTYTGSPHDAPLTVCQLVASKFPADLQDDGTKFRGVFTRNLIDQINNISWVVLDTEVLNPNRYYYIKTYAATAPSYITHWYYSIDEGTTWSNLGDNYESELNLNWFYDGQSFTNFTFRFWFNTTDGSTQMLENHINWTINATNSYPPLLSIIVPSPNQTFLNTSFPINFTWIIEDPNNDEVNLTLWINNTDTNITLHFVPTLNASNKSYLIPFGNLTDGNYRFRLEAFKLNDPTFKAYDQHDFIVTSIVTPAFEKDKTWDVAIALLLGSLILLFAFLSGQGGLHKIWLLPMSMMIFMGFKLASMMTQAHLNVVDYDADVIAAIVTYLDTHYFIAVTFFVFFLLIACIDIIKSAVWNMSADGRRARKEEELRRNFNG